ncbi:MAG: hypothetical protein KC964_26105 [Candidatus Omnitrophica bacterium]|nr:hypothetical protein [Candidatus Omnitrophota bacterium]
MPYRGLFIATCVLAFLVPFFPVESKDGIGQANFTGWPTEYEGRQLEAIPLSDREKKFEEGFPGRIAKFTDGSSEYIFRWIVSPTRKLHSASDCFRGSGYSVRSLPIVVDNQGEQWGAFSADKGDETLTVTERVFDAEDRSWPDISSWYWAATLARTNGPWWAVTVVESNDERSESP